MNLYVRGTAVSNWAEGYSLPMVGSGFASEVIGKNKTIAFNPTGLDEIMAKYPNLSDFHRAGLRSFLGSPLVTNGEAVGTIFLSSETAGAYTEHEINLLHRIANQVAGSIASATLLKAERDRTNQLEALYAVAAIMAQPLEFEAKCQGIVDTLVQITDVNKVILRRAKNASSDDLELIAEANDDGSTIEKTLSLKNQPSAASEAFHGARPVVFNDYQNHPNAQPGPVARGIKSALALPIRSAGRSLGLLSIGSKTANHFTKDRVALLTAFADELGALFVAAGLSNILQESQEEMALADEIANIITTTSNIGDVGERFTTELRKLVDFDRATLATVNREGDAIAIKYSFGPAIPGHEVGDTFPMDRSGNLATLVDGKSSFRADLLKDAKHFRDREYLALGLRSSAVVPLISQGQFVG